MYPRLPARKTPLLEALVYHSLVRPALRRAFDRIALSGDEPLGPPALPTLLYANHPSWWDGYFAFLLSYERWRRDGYLMMEEPQLARYGFFRRCGAFSVNRHDPREGMRSVAYAANLLAGQPTRQVWIFPQGEITPNDRRPLQLFSGVAHLAKRAPPVRCAPVAFRLEFLTQQRPEALIRIGPAHLVTGKVDTKDLLHDMEARLLQVVEQLRADVVDGTLSQYRTVLVGRPSVNVRWDRWRSRLQL